MSEIAQQNVVVAARDNLGLAQKDLIEQSGVSKRSVINIEKGHIPTPKIKAKLETVLGPLAFNGGEPAPAAIPAASAKHSTPAAEETVQIPYRLLIPWADQPRKDIDPDGLSDLAASINDKGILENLIVRPFEALGRGKGHTTVVKTGELMFEIIAGERRFRAVGLNIKAKKADYQTVTLPCRVMDMDDAQALEIAVTENLQRENPDDLALGRAFIRLQDAGRTTAEIAAGVGKSERFVEQRKRLVRDLAEPAKEALTAGRINFSQARELSAGDAERQADVLDEIENGYLVSKEDVREAIVEDLPGLDWALFSPADYSGPYVETDDRRQYFKDVKQAKDLQEKAIEAKAADLRKSWAWVKVLRKAKNKYFQPWDYERRTVGEYIPGGEIQPGAIIEVGRNLDVVIFEGLVPKPEAKPEAGKDDTTPGDPWTNAHLYHAHHRKTEALQVAIAGDPRAAKIAAILALAGVSEIAISPNANGVMAPGLVAALTDAAAGFESLKTDGAGMIVGIAGKSNYNPAANDSANAWRELWAADDAVLDRLFAGLVGRHVGTAAGFNPRTGDNAVARAMAESLGLVGNEADHGLALIAEDVEGLRRPVLEKVASGLEMATSGKEKVGDLKRAIVNAAGAGDQADLAAAVGYVLPTLRFGTDDEIRAAIAPPAIDTEKTDDLVDSMPEACKRTA